MKIIVWEKIWLSLTIDQPGWRLANMSILVILTLNVKNKIIHCPIGLNSIILNIPIALRLKR